MGNYMGVGPYTVLQGRVALSRAPPLPTHRSISKQGREDPTLRLCLLHQHVVGVNEHWALYWGSDSMNQQQEVGPSAPDCTPNKPNALQFRSSYVDASSKDIFKSNSLSTSWEKMAQNTTPCRDATCLTNSDIKYPRFLTHAAPNHIVFSSQSKNIY